MDITRTFKTIIKDIKVNKDKMGYTPSMLTNKYKGDEFTDILIAVEGEGNYVKVFTYVGNDLKAFRSLLTIADGKIVSEEESKYTYEKKRRRHFRTFGRISSCI